MIARTDSVYGIHGMRSRDTWQAYPGYMAGTPGIYENACVMPTGIAVGAGIWRK